MMNLFARRRSLCLALPVVLALAVSACSREDKPAVAGKPDAGDALASAASQAVSLQAIKQSGHGFTVGQELSASEVFVFFDPQCQHCATLWQESEHLRHQVKFTWIPVAILGPGSASAGSDLLAAEDKVQAMTTHAEKVLSGSRERLRLARGASAPVPRHQADIALNTQLFASLGAKAVPYVVAVNGDGKVVLSEPASAGSVAAALGLATEKR